jgi:hypothetical protein
LKVVQSEERKVVPMAAQMEWMKVDQMASSLVETMAAWMV